MTKPSDTPTETRKKVEGDKSVNFPIFEIVDSSDDNATNRETQPEEITITGNDFKLGRSIRNVGPPQFYGKNLYIDVIDETDNQPESAQNPISLDDNDRSGFTTVNINENPSDNPSHFSASIRQKIQHARQNHLYPIRYLSPPLISH